MSTARSLLTKLSTNALVELVEHFATEDKILECINVGLDLPAKKDPSKKEKKNGNGAKKKNGSNENGTKQASGKESKEDKESTTVDVLAFLMKESTDDNYIGASEVAEKLNKPIKVVSAALKKLEEDGKVTSTGERRGKKYAVADSEN